MSWVKSEDVLPIIVDICPRRGARASIELVGGVPSLHYGPNRIQSEPDPEGSVAKGVEVAQKVMQIDSRFLTRRCQNREGTKAR
jgi:hypothetical protein